MFYCDRSKAGNGCYEFGDLLDVPLGTKDDTSTGKLSEHIVLNMLWDMRDSEDDYDDDPVQVNETAFLKWVFDNSADNKANTMQDASNWDKGAQGETDLADLIYLFGCPLTEETTPKKSELKALMKDRFELEWLDEDDFCD